MKRNENKLIFEQYTKIKETSRIGSRGSRAPKSIDHDYSKFDKNGGHYNVGDRVYVEYDPASYDVDIEMRGSVTKVSKDDRGDYEYMFLQDGDSEEEGPYDAITLRPVPFDEPDNDTSKAVGTPKDSTGGRGVLDNHDWDFDAARRRADAAGERLGSKHFTH